MSIASHAGLTSAQKALLKRGKFTTVSDIILAPTQDVAKRCKVSPAEIRSIVDIICRSKPIKAQTLAENLDSCHVCSSGDALLDAALGGGFQTGMIWEVVGESSAGKTQLALRLSLLAQLSEEDGGLGGSTCYLITSGKLATARIIEISQNHSLLASSRECSLDDIHIMSTPNADFLVQALSKFLPDFVELKLTQHKANSRVKPVKLVIIDALGELFHSSHSTSKDTLYQRSRYLTDISSRLHSIASEHDIAVVVLNEVVDAFDRNLDGEYKPSLGISYSEQSRWFGRAHSIPGEDRREASLGLAWANQVNARIMMTRTLRRRYVEQSTSHKRRKTNDGYNVQNLPHSEDLTLVRRMSIIFSSVSAPTSLDYIIDPSGITILEGDEAAVAQAPADDPFPLPTAADPLPDIPSSQIAPLDVGYVEGEQRSQEGFSFSELERAPEEEDDWETFWEQNEITEEAIAVLETDQHSNV